MKIRKAIIPAAGLGTRFLPVTKAVAKEMLPLVDKPCIQFLVEEAVKSGIKEIIFIISPGDRSVKDHFSHSAKLKKRLKERKMNQALREVQAIEKMAKFKYVIQKKALGDGHAILQAAHLINNNEAVAILFGDDIYDNKIPALAQLIKQYNKVKAPIIGLHKIDKKDSRKYGMIKGAKKGELYQILNLVEKPKKAPSDLAITGKYIVNKNLLKDMAKSRSCTSDKELRLIDGMKEYLKHSKIFGLEIKGKRFDTGDKFGYLQAVTHFALKHQKLGKQYKKYLHGIDF